MYALATLALNEVVKALGMLKPFRCFTCICSTITAKLKTTFTVDSEMCPCCAE